MVIDVIATGLHPRVRSQADGSHYTSTGELPLVPGIDGAGRGPDGQLRYFILPDVRVGAMSEQAVIDPHRSIVLPEDSDAGRRRCRRSDRLPLGRAGRGRDRRPGHQPR